MKKKLTAVGLGLATVGLLAFGSPDAHATCGDGSSSVAAADGTYPDQQGPTLPDNGHVYASGDQSAPQNGGYAGIAGPHGYLEAGGTPGSSATIDGQSTDAPLSGSVSSSSGVCASVAGNDVQVP